MIVEITHECDPCDQSFRTDPESCQIVLHDTNDPDLIDGYFRYDITWSCPKCDLRYSKNGYVVTSLLESYEGFTTVGDIGGADAEVSIEPEPEDRSVPS